MTASPSIPKLPGYEVQVPAGDRSYGKKQTLNYAKGYKTVKVGTGLSSIAPSSPSATMAGGADESFATDGGDAQNAFLSSATFSPSKEEKSLPKWAANDRKVLRFFGFFKEAVPESNMENYRIRKTILYYYLEDDSMHLAEPREDNSGIPQGVFVKRHKVTKDDGGFFSPSDFAVGQEVTIYGRTFCLTDADAFTREYFQQSLSIELAPALAYPDDPITTYRAKFGLNRGLKTGTVDNSTTQRLDDFKSYMEARLGKPSHLLDADRLRQWLEGNKKVLRFYCVWDERQSLYGDRRPYVLHYFLEDSSVEILEVMDSNNGRDSFPIFLKRTHLPKGATRVAASTIGLKADRANCYGPEDFRLGQYVNILGRDFLLHDCDGFTKRWYQENLGFSEEELTQVDVKEPVKPLPKPALAPYNGYGAREDSLQNCLSLIPKAPRRDMHKLMNKDKIILRFTLRIIDTETHKHNPIDLARRFVVSYFTMDDTMLIFEPPVRNNGIGGGKFLERQKIFKPQSDEIYTHLDLYVGGTIEVFHRTFEIIEADEYTYTYMENNKHVFIMADHEILLKSLRAQVAGREEAIKSAFLSREKDGFIIGSDFDSALLEAGLKFTKHQAVSLKRRMDQDGTGKISVAEFLGALGLL